MDADNLDEGLGENQDKVKDGSKKKNKIKKKVYVGKEKLDADYGAAWRHEMSEDRWYPENGGTYGAKDS